jgi:hypothetical protein
MKRHILPLLFGLVGALALGGTLFATSPGLAQGAATTTTFTCIGPFTIALVSATPDIITSITCATPAPFVQVSPTPTHT